MQSLDPSEQSILYDNLENGAPVDLDNGPLLGHVRPILPSTNDFLGIRQSGGGPTLREKPALSERAKLGAKQDKSYKEFVKLDGMRRGSERSIVANLSGTALEKLVEIQLEDKEKSGSTTPSDSPKATLRSSPPLLESELVVPGNRSQFIPGPGPPPKIDNNASHPPTENTDWNFAERYGVPGNSNKPTAPTSAPRVRSSPSSATKYPNTAHPPPCIPTSSAPKRTFYANPKSQVCSNNTGDSPPSIDASHSKSRHLGAFSRPSSSFAAPQDIPHAQKDHPFPGSQTSLEDSADADSQQKPGNGEARRKNSTVVNITQPSNLNMHAPGAQSVEEIHPQRHQEPLDQYQSRPKTSQPPAGSGVSSPQVSNQPTSNVADDIPQEQSAPTPAQKTQGKPRPNRVFAPAGRISNENLAKEAEKFKRIYHIFEELSQSMGRPLENVVRRFLDEHQPTRTLPHGSNTWTLYEKYWARHSEEEEEYAGVKGCSACYWHNYKVHEQNGTSWEEVVRTMADSERLRLLEEETPEERGREYKKLVKRIKILAEDAADHDIHILAVIAGADESDPTLGCAIPPPLLPKVFQERILGINGNDAVTFLRHHARGRHIQRALDHLPKPGNPAPSSPNPTGSEEVRMPDEATDVGGPPLPAPNPKQERKHLSLPSGDKHDDVLMKCRFRLARYLEEASDGKIDCGYAKLCDENTGAIRTPWKELPKILARNALVIRNWPIGVRLPIETQSKGPRPSSRSKKSDETNAASKNEGGAKMVAQGMKELSTSELKVLAASLTRDSEDSFYLETLTDPSAYQDLIDGTIAVIVTTKPEPTSKYDRGRSLYLPDVIKLDGEPRALPSGESSSSTSPTQSDQHDQSSNVPQSSSKEQDPVINQALGSNSDGGFATGDFVESSHSQSIPSSSPIPDSNSLKAQAQSDSGVIATPGSHSLPRYNVMTPYTSGYAMGAAMTANTTPYRHDALYTTTGQCGSELSMPAPFLSQGIAAPTSDANPRMSNSSYPLMLSGGTRGARAISTNPAALEMSQTYQFSGQELSTFIFETMQKMASSQQESRTIGLDARSMDQLGSTYYQGASHNPGGINAMNAALPVSQWLPADQSTGAPPGGGDFGSDAMDGMVHQRRLNSDGLASTQYAPTPYPPMGVEQGYNGAPNTPTTLGQYQTYDYPTY